MDVLHRLLGVGPDPGPELMEALRSAPAEVYDQLIVILQDMELWQDPSPAGWAPVHALNFLAAAGDRRLVSVLLPLLSLPGVPDVVVEGVPTWLCALPPDDLVTLSSFARDRRRPELARASVVCVLHGIGSLHPPLRPQVLKILRQLHREADSIVVQSWLGCALAAIDGRAGASPLQTWFGDLETLRPYLPPGLKLDEVRGVPWEISFERDPLAFYQPEHVEHLKNSGPERGGWRWRPGTLPAKEGEIPPWYDDIDEAWADQAPDTLLTPASSPREKPQE